MSGFCRRRGSLTLHRTKAFQRQSEHLRLCKGMLHRRKLLREASWIGISPVSIGSYMNEPDVTNNRYQLHLAMEEARKKLPGLFDEYKELSGRTLSFWEAIRQTMQKSFSLCLARPTTLRWRLSIRSAAKGSRQASSRSMCCARSRLRSCASSARMQRPSLSPTVRTATAQAAEI